VSWLVDTNILSELRKGDRANEGVRVWFADTSEEDLFTSVLVLGELRRGIESIRRRDIPSALALEQWLTRLTTSFADRILGIDTRVADRWGRLNVPDPVPTVDGLLAATALVHDLVLVTRNTRDVERTGVRLLDPAASFSPPRSE
jgi:predicted nucleic acid-binding protein